MISSVFWWEIAIFTAYTLINYCVIYLYYLLPGFSTLIMKIYQSFEITNKIDSTLFYRFEKQRLSEIE